MINLLSKTPDYLINAWPEVFEGLNITTIPVMYLDTLTIEFMTGMVWEVDVKNYFDLLKESELNSILKDLFAEYDSEIKNVEYFFDVTQLKHDILSLTRTIFL